MNGPLRWGNWSAANTGLTDLSVKALAIDPQHPATLYAGTSGAGVFKSTDGGGTWSAFNAGLTNPSVSTLAIDPRAPAQLYAGTEGSGVFALQQSAPRPAAGLHPTVGLLSPTPR
jgi:hypothetical protein